MRYPVIAIPSNKFTPATCDLLAHLRRRGDALLAQQRHELLVRLAVVVNHLLGELLDGVTAGLVLGQLARLDLEQATGWAEGRPALAFQIALAYARCLPERPAQLPRLAALLRRAL